jgi:hypothetical protein
VLCIKRCVLAHTTLTWSLFVGGNPCSARWLTMLFLTMQDKKYGFGGAERKRAKLNDKK